MKVSSQTQTEPTSATEDPASPSTLVLLDFDGTITTKDTLIQFVRFHRGKRHYWLGMLRLAPVLILYLLKVIPNWKAKQFFLARYFKGEATGDFNAKCRKFCKEVLPALIRPGAIKAIEEYRKRNCTIAVVSASAENWVGPWCDQHGIICLATRLESKDGLITGNILGRNCYGDEKVCRIKDAFNVSSFEKIIAYGDSSGDREMLQLAHDKHYKPWRN